jgi:organic hydroperoxide reductase OsmC/OhrA
MEAMGFTIELELRQGYQFSVDFGADGPPGLEVDELPPLGAGAGPNPARILGLAVGHCLSASLLFCLRKYRIEVRRMRTRVDGTLVRNEKGRLRIGGLRVTLDPGLSLADRERAGRCLKTFEDYCIVTQSVRHGVQVDVTVSHGTP